MIAAICVLGRLDFETGYGRHTWAALELLSRHFPVVFAPSRGEYPSTPLHLPSGRRVEIADPAAQYGGYFYCDVPWNGFDDFRQLSIPSESFRVAHLAWDSDILPPAWVDKLNSHFDLCLFTSSYLIPVARRSGVTIDLGTMPVGLDLGELLEVELQKSLKPRIVFGSLSAFHPRKNLRSLILAFTKEFAAGEDVVLKLHSGLRISDEHSKVRAILDLSDDSRIVVSDGNLTEHDKNLFLRTLDIYVNVSAGEGYSIGPREALSLGMPTVLSDIPAHHDLIDLPGVTPVASSGPSPAFYPEISNQTYGSQQLVAIDDIRKSLRRAFVEVTEGKTEATRWVRRAHAAQFDFQNMSDSYRRVFNDTPPVRVENRVLLSTELPLTQVHGAKVGRRGSRVGAKRLIVPVHDGGFFSIFNVFMANLVWSSRDESIDSIIPDWRAVPLLNRLDGKQPTSYCYSQPDQGNLWNLLYQPLYDLSTEEMNSDEFLTNNAVSPSTNFAEDKEPLLTHTNAYQLYRQSWFPHFRQQYHETLRQHVHLLPEFRKEIDRLLPDPASGVFRISAHVRHPSHAMEQPSGRLAGVDEYVSRIREILDEKKIDEKSEEWELFLATDNNRAIRTFSEIFGEHVRFVAETDRVGDEQFDVYDSLDDEKSLQEGHQIQHLNAADRNRWSHLKAFEVWRDAELLAASDVVLHAVSNVATAVAFLNPKARMVFCDPVM
jgi:glycosyltransferase involved in cell wall biosynthesis